MLTFTDLNVIWPQVLDGPDEGSVYFRIYCQNRAVFHAIHHATAVHQALREGQLARVENRETLAHKIKAIELLNDGLLTAEHEALEPLLMTVMLLATNELREKDLRVVPPLAIRPHCPDTGWLSLYAKTDVVPEHVKAIELLVGRLGGLKNLKTPGLAGNLATYVNFLSV